MVEVCALMAADPPTLQPEALEIFQRGLDDVGIAPLEYVSLRHRFPERFRDAADRLYRVSGTRRDFRNSSAATG